MITVCGDVTRYGHVTTVTTLADSDSHVRGRLPRGSWGVGRRAPGHYPNPKRLRPMGATLSCRATQRRIWARARAPAAGRVLPSDHENK